MGILRGAKDQLFSLQNVDEARVARDDGSDEVNDSSEHDVKGIGRGDAAADFVQKIDRREAIAESGHGWSGYGNSTNGFNRTVPRVCRGAFHLKVRYRGDVGRGATAFLLQNFGGILCGLINQETHLRPGRLEIGLNAIVSEFFGRRRTDGNDDHVRQSATQILPAVHLLRNLKQVDDLHGSHEEHNIYAALRDSEDALAQRAYVFGEGPLIDRDLGDFGALLIESG